MEFTSDLHKQNISMSHITELENEDEVTHDISELTPNKHDATDNQILSNSQIKMVEDMNKRISLSEEIYK